MPNPGATAVRYTLALDTVEWNAISQRAGLFTERQQAEVLGVTRETLNRVRNGRQAPGPEFIAAVRIAFPTADTGKLFRLVEKAA